MPSSLFRSCLEGTDNRMFTLGRKDDLALVPEVTNYIRAMGPQRLGTPKVYYVARCFRAETTTDRTRLREFTQVGVEFLGSNPLDCCKVVRKDARRLFEKILPPFETERYGGQQEWSWALSDGVERGINLYDQSGKTFEITSLDTTQRRQLLGGGPYEGGAGWALGLERLMVSLGP